MQHTLAVPVTEATQTGEARRAALQLAESAGLDEETRGKLALVVTEVAANLVKHAREGQVLLQTIEHDGRGGIEVIAVDRGPGMADLSRCLQDGYSTAGTAGGGLGAMGRLSDSFDVQTQPGVGTAIVLRLWSRADASAPTPSELGVVSVPLAGESVCGDGWGYEASADRLRVMVCDGLGHGTGAATASLEARRIFYEHPQDRPAELLRRMHDALRATRGAAVAMAEIDLRSRAVRYAGIGNIVAAIYDRTGARQNLVSLNGTVGHQARTVQEFSYTWPAGAVLVMHSDGVSTQWRLEHYAGLVARDPALVAAVLYRDFRRGRDDATVLVLRDPHREER